VLDFIKIKT
jgi:hypothetical protein